MPFPPSNPAPPSMDPFEPNGPVMDPPPEDKEAQVFVGGDAGAIYFDTSLDMTNYSGQYAGIRHGQDLYTEVVLKNNELIPKIKKGYFTLNGHYYYTAGLASGMYLDTEQFTNGVYSGIFDGSAFFALDEQYIEYTFHNDNIIEITEELIRVAPNMAGGFTINDLVSGSYYWEDGTFYVKQIAETSGVYLAFDLDDNEFVTLDNTNLYDSMNSSFYFGIIDSAEVASTIIIYPKYQHYEMYAETQLDLTVLLYDEKGSPLLSDYYLIVDPVISVDPHAEILFNNADAAVTLSEDINAPTLISCDTLAKQSSITFYYNDADWPLGTLDLKYSLDGVIWKTITIIVGRQPNVSADIARYDVNMATYYAVVASMGYNISYDIFTENLDNQLLANYQDLFSISPNTLSGLYQFEGIPNSTGTFYTYAQAYQRPPIPYWDYDATDTDELDLDWTDSQDLGANNWFDCDKTVANSALGIWTLADIGANYSKTVVGAIILANQSNLYVDKRGFPIWNDAGTYKIPTTVNGANVFTAGIVVAAPNFILDNVTGIKTTLLALLSGMKYITYSANVGEIV